MKAKTKKTKTFYKGVFNFRTEMDVMYSWAFSQNQAWAVFCRRISEKHLVPVQTVMDVFEHGKSNYSIKEETP
jgi:hypothetical protein